MYAPFNSTSELNPNLTSQIFLEASTRSTVSTIA